jgi:AraC-like DNA-binding protein
MKTSESNGDRINRLLEATEKVLGAYLCLHNRSPRVVIASKFRQHRSESCLAKKQIDHRVCGSFGGSEVHRALAGNPDGRIHDCPYGFTEIALPVMSEGLFVGVLFCGPFCTTGEEMPHPDLLVAPSRAWLEDRRILLKAVATEIGVLMMGDKAFIPQKRQAKILECLDQAMARTVAIEEVAEEIGLSPSRAGHLIKELFGLTFPGLQRKVKLTEAANLLITSDLPIGKIAEMVGFSDPNYFSRQFAREFCMSALDYRRKYPAQA